MGARTLEKSSMAKGYLGAGSLEKNSKRLEMGSWTLAMIINLQ